MIPKDQLDEIKAAHPELWNAKRAAGLNDQQTAQVILAQIEHDKNHPPHLEAVAEVKKLIVLTNRKGTELAALRASVTGRVKELGEHANLLDVEILSAPADGDVSGLNKLLEEHRELVKQQLERIKELEAECDLKAERILQLEDNLKASQEAPKAAPKPKK